MATIFPPNPQINDEYNGYRWTGTTWDLIGFDATGDFLTIDDTATNSSKIGGRTIYVQEAQPTANAIGDIWFQVTGL